MKKLLVLMLSLMLVLSLAACGDEDSKTDDKKVSNENRNSDKKDSAAGDNDSVKSDSDNQPGTDVESGSAEESIAEFLKDVTLMEVPSWLPDSGWELVGARLDGEELGQSAKESVLAQYGGMLMIIFGDTESDVRMLQGSGTLEGSCQRMEDEYTVAMTFADDGSELNYTAVFINPKPGYRYMLLFLDESAKNVYYFWHIEEG